MRKKMRRRRKRRRSKSTSLLNPDLFLSASWFVNFFQVLSLCDKLSHAFSVILNGTQAARLPYLARMVPTYRTGFRINLNNLVIVTLVTSTSKNISKCHS